MTDKELLELAAKAVGIKKDDSPYNGGGFGNDGFDCMGNMVTDWHNNKRWNPLTNDGDAFRLLVSLNLEISIAHDNRDRVFAERKGVVCFGENRSICPEAATRRAIVRSAAEIGSMVK